LKIGTIEIILVEAIILSLVYALDSYVGLLLCLIIAVLSAAILIISLIAEVVERSKVPKSYFSALATICLTAIVVMVFFSIFLKGSFSWMN